MLNSAIKFLIANRPVAWVVLLLLIAWGCTHAPFNLTGGLLPSNPVSVDAIPDIGENQQIVYTQWEGRSPQDVEDQITYPLSTNLLGVSGIKTIRSSSMFGFSSIHVVFEEEVDFYWARSRLLEKLSSFPSDLLPQGVRPMLGPDATALGQVFWYTLEGRDQEGKVTGGWDLHELRSVQDFYVKNALSGVNGVAEVASIGGYVQEYQIDVDPERMRQFNVGLSDVVRAVRESNRDVGAKTLEINQAEYFVRGLGYLSGITDIENTEVRTENFAPVRIRDIARVTLGPAERRGMLDKEGAEVVGGVVVARYGANPMETIKALRKKIKEIAPALPSKTLKDGRISQLTLVPFYDRSQLIAETLGTLGSALTYELLITLLVVLVLLFNLRISLLVSSIMPVAVIMVFIAMKWGGVDANIVALSGIAIAIGTMVDMGVILSENILRHMDMAKADDKVQETVYRATTEVSGAILTAGLTTIVSFIPVFALSGAEGKLFAPLAFTKTAALVASMLVALFLIPPVAVQLFAKSGHRKNFRVVSVVLLLLSGVIALFLGHLVGGALIGIGMLQLLGLLGHVSNEKQDQWQRFWCLFCLAVLLAHYWRPLGYGVHFIGNALFIVVVCALVLGGIWLFKRNYPRILLWTLRHKMAFLSLPIALLVCGMVIMFNSGREFMPSLNEGSFLLMPSAMPHAGTSENKRVLAQLDMAVAAIPEIATVVGKAGRANSALDPAPLSMYENIILYKPEFILGDDQRPLRFKTNEKGLFETVNGEYMPSGSGLDREQLVQDDQGDYYRNWRPEVNNVQDIWNLVSEVTQLPGITNAPKLQPIETRLVMLQTGMRAPMGIKIRGEDLREVETFGLALEPILKKVEGVKAESVFAERIVGKPYLLIAIDRKKIARYGIHVMDVQEVLEVAVGGKVLVETVEGRERYGVRVRYPRELRSTPEELAGIYMEASDGVSVPLGELVTIRYEQGPQAINSEDGFLVGHVLFDKEEGYAEVNVVTKAKEAIAQKLQNGELQRPPKIDYIFSGTYENQLRAQKTLLFVVPLVLLVIFLILYLQFRSVAVTLMVFSGVAVAFAGGFVLLWLYGQSWFLNIGSDGHNLRNLFNIKTINLSVAVWVGFIALFGIATDDGVLMATYIKQRFAKRRPTNVETVRGAVLEAGKKRLRPCLITTATTLLALLPILMATGRGSDIMVPMAVPAFGGMLVALLSLFIVPVLYSWRAELKLNRKEKMD